MLKSRHGNNSINIKSNNQKPRETPSKKIPRPKRRVFDRRQASNQGSDAGPGFKTRLLARALRVRLSKHPMLASRSQQVVRAKFGRATGWRVREKRSRHPRQGTDSRLKRRAGPRQPGTLLRSAYAFGFPSVVLSPGCADVYNPKTIQSSQGALFHVHVEKADIEPWILEARSGGYTVYATALQAYSIFLSEIRFPQKFALVLGNEGTGLPQTTIALCDACIKIEMSAFESLNVAIAGSICMYEALVQRSK